MVAQNLMQLLVRLNDIEKDSQICKCNKQTNSNMWHMEKHTQIDKWGRATKNELKMWNPRKMLVAQHYRDASRIAQQADTKLVHNLLSKNAMTSIPSMLYVWYSNDMIQDVSSMTILMLYDAMVLA